MAEINVYYPHNVFKFNPYTPSVFLAGPSRRPSQEKLPDWRKEAEGYFREAVLSVNLYNPEHPDMTGLYNPKDQTRWEHNALKSSHSILFWVPRSDELPGFTTNIEFGMYYKSKKIVLGYPVGTSHIGYMNDIAEDEGVPITNDLKTACHYALAMAYARRYSK